MSGYAGFPYAGGAYAGASAASGSTDVGTDLPTVIVALDDGTGTFPYDITSFVEIGADGGPITQSYGREDEQGSVQASSVSLVLNNTDGRFTLGDTTIDSPSPIFVNNQIRLTYAVGATSSVRFTGFVQSWPVSWPGGGEAFSVVQVTAVDRLARLSRRVLRSVVEEEILLDEPLAFYTLGEPAASTSAGDTSGNAKPSLTQGQVGTGGSITFGAGTGSSYDGLTAPVFARASDGNGKFLSATLPEGFAPPFAVTVSFVPDATADDMLIVGLRGGAGAWLAISWDGANLNCVKRNGGGTTVLSSQAMSTGALHTFSIQVAADRTFTIAEDGATGSSSFGAGDDFSDLRIIDVGGRESGSSAYGVYGSLFNGTIAHVAVFDSLPGATRLTAQSDAILTGFVGESSDDRIARYAEYGGIATADMVLDTGVVTSVPHLDITGMNVLDAISQVAAAEQGLVFVRGDDKLVFQNRHYRSGQTAGWSFDASPNLQGDVAFSTDMQQVFNHVTASRVDGPTQVAQDATSIATHGQYPASFDNLLVSTDAEALDLAQWVVSNYSEPGARLPGATIDLLANTTSFKQAWLNRDLSDRISVTNMPSQAPTSTADLLIEGWTETLSATEWTTTLNTTPFALAAGWILDDATYSVLDSTTILGA